LLDKAIQVVQIPQVVEAVLAVEVEQALLEFLVLALTVVLEELE
jgi:hypothetical protein